ncbi:hypothetical protein KIPB_002783 [Kipferlia bialata]|uniref:Uncharacterized protein n=1 Tax=Kipferlia bialata TaxID=797122 RepID=A0A9K3CSZ5_9EUKA|nr:hypothetical protein KIPB_002783 [Kipferlia bialata]|eukprot:g2783.t1
MMKSGVPLSALDLAMFGIESHQALERALGTSLRNRFPTVCRAVGVECPPPREGHPLIKTAQRNKVLDYARALRGGLDMPTHKYLPYQVAALYQALQSMPSVYDGFTKEIEGRFSSIKEQANRRTAGANPVFVSEETAAWVSDVTVRVEAQVLGGVTG